VCTPCRESGWRCDFQGILRPLISPSSLQLADTDAIHFDYFRFVCAPEFSLFFQADTWSGLVLQAARTDQSFRRIALAVGALSRSRYATSQQQPQDGYALRQYNLAIRELSLLEHSPRNVLRITLASIILIALEFLLENYNRVQIHLRSAIFMLSALEEGQFESETAFYLQALTYVQDMMSCRYWTTLTLPDAKVPD